MKSQELVTFGMKYNAYSLAVAGGLVVVSSLIAILRCIVALRILCCIVVEFGLKETDMVCELM